jgi:hypothetical protein
VQGWVAHSPWNPSLRSYMMVPCHPIHLHVTFSGKYYLKHQPNYNYYIIPLSEALDIR